MTGLKSVSFSLVLTGLLFLVGCNSSDEYGFYRKIDLKVKDVEVQEDGRFVEISYRLISPYGEELSFSWRTQDGQARAGQDYEDANGTIHFASGETESSDVVRISITDDEVLENQESFYILFALQNSGGSGQGGNAQVREGIRGEEDLEDPESLGGLPNVTKRIRVSINDDEFNPSLPSDGTIKVDTFTQSKIKRPVDILWVVDDSGSMHNDQQRLASNFGQFIDHFVGKAGGNQLDFKMGVTTTTVLDPSHSYNKDYSGNGLTDEKMRENRSAFIETFKQKIRVGTSGSPYEQGFHGSVKFLEQNRNWMREESLLSIIYLSDEPDSSGGTVDSWLEMLYGLRGNKLVKTHAIALKSGDRKGRRYFSAATKTGGLSLDIGADFATNLRSLSDSIYLGLSSFLLSQRPSDPAHAMEVRVNDRVLLASDWFYDSNLNAIKFAVGKVPDNGDVVKVFYRYR
ncbi:MAG: hypothetical protein OXB88_09810 [Bacteriovoracales bacterium]|nr:hypothetical protein [Bacteriovoracales bacterium]